MSAKHLATSQNTHVNSIKNTYGVNKYYVLTFAKIALDLNINTKSCPLLPELFLHVVSKGTNISVGPVTSTQVSC